jgi:DNA-binding transcriptional LysR family regulator
MNTDAILTCPERLALTYCQQFDLVLRPLPTPKIEIELQMIWHERKNLDPFQVWIRQQIEDIFSNVR